MAKKEAVKPDEKPAYEMPPVELGDTVLWHASPEEPPVCSAVVTDIGHETINCSCLHRNFYNMEPKDGVRHKDHPNRDIIATTEQGCWSHKPGFLDAAARIAELEAICMGEPVKA
jgi:hypothetical protein